jgi:hypothetical protein
MGDGDAFLPMAEGSGAYNYGDEKIEGCIYRFHIIN